MGYLLNVLVWLPIASAIVILFIGNDNNKNLQRYLALLTVIFTLLLSMLYLYDFDVNVAGMQYIEDFVWMRSLGVRYTLGIDGLSLLLIVLSIFTNLIVILSTWNSIQNKLAQYLAAFLIMQGLLVGVFAAMDAIPSR